MEMWARVQMNSLEQSGEQMDHGDSSYEHSH